MKTQSCTITRKGKAIRFQYMVPDTLSDLDLFPSHELLSALKIGLRELAKQAALRSRPRHRWLKVDLLKLPLEKRIALEAFLQAETAHEGDKTHSDIPDTGQASEDSHNSSL